MDGLYKDSTYTGIVIKNKAWLSTLKEIETAIYWLRDGGGWDRQGASRDFRCLAPFLMLEWES